MLLFRIWSYGKSWLGVGGRGLVRSKEQELDQSSRRKLRPRIRTNLFCHPEALLFMIWAWVSAKDGSIIWDEGLRTTLRSVQRLFLFCFLRSSITSPDVPPGITSSRQRASLPGEASLASCRRQACVHRYSSALSVSRRFSGHCVLAPIQSPKSIGQRLVDASICK